MKITAISFTNIRGFKYLQKTELSKSLNVFIGSNNAGKSTILNAIYLIQNPAVLTGTDITFGQKQGFIDLYVEGGHLHQILPEINQVKFDLFQGNRSWKQEETPFTHWGGTTLQIEPHNLIYPYLSKRKVVTYSETISETNANSVNGNFSNLFSKIDRLVTPPNRDANKQYTKACKDILGFEVMTKQAGDGKKAGYFVDDDNLIPLTCMGEGVANILGIITDLCVAKDRIFIIEEPENDIHPKALKSLLKLIAEKSRENQFFISTHSNIVMKYLGSLDNSKIFNVTNNVKDDQNGSLFISKLKEVSNDPEERRQVLEDLGYDFFDFDIWKGWLFLEEASLEYFIREYFIDWYAPLLKGKVRTFSAKGVDNVIPKVDDFNRLFVYLHLQETYKNRVWVLIDAGEHEKKIVEELKVTYTKSGWQADNFSQLSKHDFEEFYPSFFKEEVATIVALQDNNGNKRKAKLELLKKVELWVKHDSQKAKEEFAISASEIIEHLKKIEEALK